jgi:MoxR-like ATPase
MQTFDGGISPFASFVRRYFLGNGPVVPSTQYAAPTRLPARSPQEKIFVTGEALVARILDAIRARRPVLLTGPRGCGKSYCADRATRLARDRECLIGGWRFLQGNREVPRETLSEDALIIDEDGKPQNLIALALRPLAIDDELRQRLRQAEMKRRGIDSPDDPRWQSLLARREAYRKKYRHFPAIPSGAVTPTDDPREAWFAEDWVVLLLDEINRFGDGLLDSCLSLLEEGKIIRRGEDYYVPIVVVATANPPGYDPTAKKLSPPLAARIARAYRVSQPPLEDLMLIIRHKLRAVHARHDVRYHVPPDLARLAAWTTLCLWGSVHTGGQGIKFLASATRIDLAEVMAADAELAAAMEALSRLVTFGPDARSVGDWLECAVGLAESRREAFTASHLLETAVEVLGHKVRENYNEGAEPGKVAEKEDCILRIVGRLFDRDNPVLVEVLFRFARATAAATGGSRIEPGAAEGVLADRVRELPAGRDRAWVQVLATLPRTLGPKELEAWRQGAVRCGALSAPGTFLDCCERDWLVGLLETVREAPGAAALVREWPFLLGRDVEAFASEHGLSRALREGLRSVADRHREGCLARGEDVRAWLDAAAAMAAAGPDDAAAVLVALARAEAVLLRAQGRTPEVVRRLLSDTLRGFAAVADAPKEACLRCCIEALPALARLPIGRAATCLRCSPEQDPGPIEARVRDAVNELLARLNRTGTYDLRKLLERASAWVETLARLDPKSPDIVRAAKETGALERECHAPHSVRFSTIEERDWIQSTLRAARGTGWPATALASLPAAAADEVGRLPICAGPLVRPALAGTLPCPKQRLDTERVCGALMDALEEHQHFTDLFFGQAEWPDGRRAAALRDLAGLVGHAQETTCERNLAADAENLVHRLANLGREAGATPAHARKFLTSVLTSCRARLGGAGAWDRPLGKLHPESPGI